MIEYKYEIEDQKFYVYFRNRKPGPPVYKSKWHKFRDLNNEPLFFYTQKDVKDWIEAREAIDAIV